MSDTDNNLADSAYEIINGVDSESQDGLMSESTGSLEVSRPDDVHSLDGSENQYDSDSDDESDHSSHASSIRYADQVLESPSSHAQAGSLQYSPCPGETGGAVGSIEFQEGDGSVGAGKISVKHTVREFTEEETAAIANKVKMGTAPRRLVATVRQTMSQSYLSTKEPLRILYVGRPDKKREIILKISNAIWASSKNTTAGEPASSQHGGGVYNIVPISSFGPTPELDLMEASQYQIKVEHCTAAFGLAKDSFMYSVTIDNDHRQTYTTGINSEGDFFVHPQWTLPHIAIFYCADDDSGEDEQTREAAWRFMKRHAVSSLFVSESEVFTKDVIGRWDGYVDKDAVHLCLETRESEPPTAPQRFPIDLASFLNIDARQMNRNLAHLAGMPQALEKADLSASQSAKSLLSASVWKAWEGKPSQEQILYNIEHNKWFVALLVPIFMALMAPFLSALVGWPHSANNTPPAQASVTDILGLSSTACAAHPTALLKAATASTTTTSTTTVVVNVTSTKTIKVSHVLPTTSSLASALSFAGLLSDRPSETPVEPVKKTTCSVRVFSPNEVLITLPPGKKASWLARGAIDVDVFRGDEHVKTKLSSVDEGILVEIPQKDAYGTLNVSVVTSRKPKINETFEVDFGKAVVTEAFEAGLNMLQGIAKMVYSTVDEAVGAIEDAHFPDLAKLRSEAVSAWDQTKEAGKRQYEKDFKEFKESLSHFVESARRIRNEADMSILHAQITSKLWWLKVTGRKEEFVEYKRNATVFIKAKYVEMLQHRRKALEKPKMSCKFGRACSRHHADAKPDAGRSGRWRKLILG